MFKKKIKWLAAECLDVQIYQTLVTIMLLTILRHIQNPGILDALRIKFQNHVKYLRWWAYWEPWHSQNSICKHFQGYLRIFKNIDANSATLTGAQLGREGGRSLLLIFEKLKGSVILEKKFWLCPSLGLIFHSNCSFKSI